MATPSAFSWPRKLDLRAGDWAIVRSKQEILATLDEQARLDGLPFQPEMFAFCGQRLRVSKVAHKTCDTINKTGGRRMMDAVHLDGARCGGDGHGGCMADCVFFWKEAWLQRDGAPAESATTGAGNVCSEEQVRRAATPTDSESTDPAYSCQTTALYDATTSLRWWDPRQYIRDVTSRNHSASHITKLILASWYRNLVGLGVGYRLLVGAYNRFQRWVGGQPFPIGAGAIPDGQRTPHEVLDLQPGEWVEVKPTKEILATITVSGFNRGMRYDMEMGKYSGGRFRVQKRVSKLINEQTGKMTVMKSPCIQLEDVYCRAECTPMRLGCPRASNTYWREIWLRRVDEPSAQR